MCHPVVIEKNAVVKLVNDDNRMQPIRNEFENHHRSNRTHHAHLNAPGHIVFAFTQLTVCRRERQGAIWPIEYIIMQK